MTLRAALEGKRVGVVLSAGYFGFYGHAGFVEALEQEGVEVAAWAGTSAGGLIAALRAAGVSNPAIRELLSTQRREHFWDPDYLGIAIDSVRKGHRSSGLLKGDQFRALIEKHLPVHRFEELTVPLLLVATNLTTESPVIITSGDLATAIHATCAYPGLFQAVRHDSGLLWDGGIVDKAGASPNLCHRVFKASRRLTSRLSQVAQWRQTSGSPHLRCELRSRQPAAGESR